MSAAVHTNTTATIENAPTATRRSTAPARSRRGAFGRRTAPAYDDPSTRRTHDATCETAPMRVLVARCTVSYAGRLGARLAPGIRLVLIKADGSIAIHSDSKAYKPLNWMSPPCSIAHGDGTIVATNPKGETLEITLHEVIHDTEVDLGDDPGLEKDGVEAELQQLIAARVAALREDFVLVRREFPTDIGPIDLLSLIHI